MTDLMIRVYKGGETEPDTTVRIPGNILKVATAILPKKVAQALADKGVDVAEIVRLSEDPGVRGVLIEIDEHKKKEKVVISLE